MRYACETDHEIEPDPIMYCDSVERLAECRRCIANGACDVAEVWMIQMGVAKERREELR